MTDDYVKTVQLLLRAAPAVFETQAFAMKGGTALNLFVQDMPRLSMNIDVVFRNHALNRADALAAIGQELLQTKGRLEKLRLEADIRKSADGSEAKLFIRDQESTVKVEVNFVFRGTLLPPRSTSLTQAAQDKFAANITVPVLQTPELYGGKLVAAMDRQHPRDLFDVKLMYEKFGLTQDFVGCFVAYLAGHNRPVHEVLFPPEKDIAQAYAGEFQGMTATQVGLEELLQVRQRLIGELPRVLTDKHRQFLLSLVKLEPDWDLLEHAHVEKLPAVRWKLENLTKLRKASPARFQQQFELLVERFNALG